MFLQPGMSTHPARFGSTSKERKCLGLLEHLGVSLFVCSADVVHTFKDLSRETSTRWARHEVIVGRNRSWVDWRRSGQGDFQDSV